MALSSRSRRDVADAHAPLAPIQFRLEGREEQFTTDDGRRLTGRGYVICDAKTGAPLGEDDFFFRIGGGIVCDLVAAERHLSQLQSRAFGPGHSLALVAAAAADGDAPTIEVRDAGRTVVVGQLPPDVADAVHFYGTETYGSAFCLWEWRAESGTRFALRLLLAPGWTVEEVPEEPPPEE
jgi:hypothetical protein